MYDLFISYSRRDGAFVDRVDNALAATGRAVWMDRERIAPTAEWLAEIQAGIEDSNTFVFVVSPESLASEMCLLELNHATAHGKRILPVLHRPADSSTIPDDLGRRQWIEFGESDDFDRSLAALDAALDVDVEWQRGL